MILPNTYSAASLCIYPLLKRMLTTLTDRHLPVLPSFYGRQCASATHGKKTTIHLARNDSSHSQPPHPLQSHPSSLSLNISPVPSTDAVTIDSTHVPALRFCKNVRLEPKDEPLRTTGSGRNLSFTTPPRAGAEINAWLFILLNPRFRRGKKSIGSNRRLQENNARAQSSTDQIAAHTAHGGR